MVYTAVTHDGEPAVLTPDAAPEAPGDVAFPPVLVGVVVVVAIAAFASAVCYVAQATAEVIDRKLTNDALTARLVQTQAQALGLVNDHTERQRKEARPIPGIRWSSRCSIRCSRPSTRSRRVRTSPCPTPFRRCGRRGPQGGKKLAEVGTDLGVFAALLGGVYVLTR